MSDDVASSAIRVSLGLDTTEDDVVSFAETWLDKRQKHRAPGGVSEAGVSMMAALDNTTVKEGVDQETVDAVREVGGKYKYGW